MSVKKQLLDPVSTLCKLIALNFSELHTKISIHNHILCLQKPNNYQFMVRMMNGDGRENVSELFYVIIRILKWYLTQDDLNNSDENWVAISKSEEIKKLVRYACISLKKLQETYEYGNVILAIQFYINLLEDSVNGYFDESKLPQYIIDKEKEFENLLDYDKLKNIWDFKKLKRICDLYDNFFSVYDHSDMIPAEKEALINGYLKSVNAILELADFDFQKLIKNSNQG